MFLKGSRRRRYSDYSVPTCILTSLSQNRGRGMRIGVMDSWSLRMPPQMTTIETSKLHDTQEGALPSHHRPFSHVCMC